MTEDRKIDDPENSLAMIFYICSLSKSNIGSERNDKCRSTQYGFFGGI